ncbi:PREDICTED: uncharacterized protein LOC108366498 [Rhagoletis zephyria]|uniref:uncharacterized protein LOC108366498 n=1 Tax=Rhagoletis zephyria TaxID=28612 RepID=UPI0008118018|nr:PREDICTED: uncharacterized protein LOC108366498 [Rhagoletis zephyria]
MSLNDDQVANSGGTTTTDMEAMVVRLHKLPEFYPEDPETWFEKLESIFHVNNIRSEPTKFHYIFGFAPPEVNPYATSVNKEAIPADKTKYSVLGERVIQAFSCSEETKLRKLFKGQTLGNQKPTQFLMVLRNAASGSCNKTVLKSLFLEHLPDTVRAILAVSPSDDIDSLALIADKIMKNQSPTNVFEVKHHQRLPSPSKFDKLMEDISALTMKVDKLASTVKTLQSNRRYSRVRSTSIESKQQRKEGPMPQGHNPSICFFHNKYGIKAKKCNPPCLMAQDTSSSEN